MHPEVARVFNAFSERFEGRVPYFYLDILGLVTIGVGNLVDPIEEALKLADAPWAFAAEPGRVVTPDDLRADWRAVKARTDLARAGHRPFAAVARLRLAGTGIDALVERKARAAEEALKSRTPAFAGFDAWPADAQLGLLSMAWAMGDAFARGDRWPSFRAACLRREWLAAAAECRMRDDGNPGLRRRNEANVELFRSAARTEAQGGPWDRLTSPLATGLLRPATLAGLPRPVQRRGGAGLAASGAAGARPSRRPPAGRKASGPRRRRRVGA